MKTDLIVKILILIYILAVGTVLYLYGTGTTEGTINNIYGVAFLGLIPVLGGISGLAVSRKWGSLKSAVGRAILFLSLGLISWGVGTFIFSGVYNLLLQVEIPYPSFADVGYILSLPLWAYGMIEISRASGAQFGLRGSGGRVMLLLIPLIVIAASYYLLVVIARGGSIGYEDSELLKLFFDFAYPIGDVVILTIATLIYGLSYEYFGGVYKKAIYAILFGFVLMYAADFAFSYTTTLGTWHPADWVDLLFTTAVLVLSIGVNMFDPERYPSAQA